MPLSGRPAQIDIDFHSQLHYNAYMPSPQQIFNDFIKQQGLKTTAQRQIVLDTFLTTEKHLSAEDLYKLACKKDPCIGLATVHRTLKLMKEAGVAREVNFGDGIRRFEHLLGHPHHDHFICEVCGKVIEFVDPEIEKKQEKLCNKHKFEGKSHLMQIFGVCKACRKRGK